jgi:hypothetical protein
MSMVVSTILDFGRIVLNLISYCYRFYYQNKGCRFKLVDVSLQIVKLSEGLSER